MSKIHDGLPASPGIVIGPARVLRWDLPAVPHGAIAPDQVEAEVQRFLDACDAVKQHIRSVQQRAHERMGAVEAQIFEPQLLMLEDDELIGGTISYVRENLLTAERAFEWRVLEWEAQWSHTAHPMVLDKLNDLADVQARVLRRLLQIPEPDPAAITGAERVVLVARDLIPSLVVQLDASCILGIALDGGTRNSHSAILARSLGIPCVVSLGTLSDEVAEGEELILDGRSGRIVRQPSEEERHAYRERDFQIREWEQELLLLAHLDAVTRDGAHVALRANLDLPTEAASARAHGAEGIGLFRTEFLVVGRSVVPGEAEQYQAYRQVVEAFPGHPVIIRTYDLGGDKFPTFLHLAPEENPFLGWRAIRLCLDELGLFRAQLRALLRAGAHGDVRIMLPMINEIAEVEATRALLDEAAADLRAAGETLPPRYSLGVMVETPAAALSVPELATHVDFFSIGTNDLVQYTLAVDRGSPRVARLYKPFHPGVVRLMHGTVEAARAAGREISVCGELAAHPLGAFMMIGMGVDALSVSPSSMAEVKKLVRSVSRQDARAAVHDALAARTADEVVDALRARLPDQLDLSLFAGSWSLSKSS